MEWIQAKLALAQATVDQKLAELEAEADTAHGDHSPTLLLYCTDTLLLYRTDEAAQHALGPETSKEQYAAIIGLVVFSGADLHIRAEFVEDLPEV